MSRFLAAEAFHATENAIQLLPFRFERLGAGGYLVSNMVGDFVRLSANEFGRLVEGKVSPGDDLYEKAFAAHLVSRVGQAAQLQIIAARLRSRMAFLQAPSALHMFVVTLRCEHSCPYCQVSRQSTDKTLFDMSESVAERSLAISLESPAPQIKIEFQGGEPLLNFALITKIVENAIQDAPRVGKKVEFVIASNLALLTDDILAYCKRNNILLSTSLDGPEDLHNRNRPRSGGNSYKLAVDGIKAAQKVLGADRVGALMTTTEASLDRIEEIIDEYVALGLDGIFLRPLSPYGFAVKTKQIKKYDSKRWLDFYSRGLRYILDINRAGQRFFEFYTLLLLRRLLTDEPIGYVDLRSPAGIGIGALVYNYDGKVFASDEGRMLAEMGDNTFELGHVDDNDYRSLILSEKLIELVSSSLTQCAPECLNCIYESHCGANPVFHHATQKDAVGIKPLSFFCARQKGVLGALVDILDGTSDDARILRQWGGAVTLALHGVASHVRGFDSDRPWQVIRARGIGSTKSDDADAVLIVRPEDISKAAKSGFEKAILIGDVADGGELPNVIRLPEKYGYLGEGDLLGLQAAAGRFRTLYRRSSAHNSFLVTERCNHYCLMCSQPPRDVDDRWILDEIKAAVPLVDPQTKSFAFTGGEPLLEWRAFIEVLEQCRDVLPNTAIHVLTNGRAFANSAVVSAWTGVKHPCLMAAIPLYSAVDHVHDYVVQAQGAFHETVLGILKLKDRGQRVELRVVLHAITAPRILDTCRWIARNLPFVDHVALMGLENTGFTLANMDRLWIDPIDYQEPLARAVECLSFAGVSVSVYNLPRCVLAKSTWPYAVQSISDWKNGFVAACDACIERPRCSGFFTSGRPKHSRGVSPITTLTAVS